MRSKREALETSSTPSLGLSQSLVWSPGPQTLRGMKLRGILLAVACAWTLTPSGGAVPVPQLDPAEEAEVIANGKKYFHEPGTNDILGHYDRRFFQGTVTYEEKGNTQYHMIRAYLSAFQDLGLETWIAHGTLLGWWWNSQVFLSCQAPPSRILLIYSFLRCYPGTGISIPKYPTLRSNTWQDT